MKDSGRNEPSAWNLANAITLGRLFISFVFFFLLYKGKKQSTYEVAVGLFLVASLTDFLDGWVARKRNEVTAFGRMADPLVDKVLICGAMILLCFKEEAEHLGMTAGVAAVVVIRELLVTFLRGYMESEGIPFGASWTGKAKLVVQTAAVLAVLFGLDYLSRSGRPLEGNLYWTVRGLLWVTMGITVWSGLEYLLKAWKHLRGEFRA